MQQRRSSWPPDLSAQSRWVHLHLPTLSTHIRHRLATATDMDTAIEHGTDALRAGRFRVETAHPTKARLVADGALGTAARAVTRFRAESANRIGDTRHGASVPQHAD